MENLIKKIEVFETGSICIDMNRPIETDEDMREYFSQLNRAYETYKINKNKQILEN